MMRGKVKICGIFSVLQNALSKPSPWSHHVGMLFALKRLVLLFVLVVAVYCFWPRTPSLYSFDPERMAELQTTIWRDASAKKRQELIFPLYETYERQYHLPPISSLKMAFDSARAHYIFYSAPDAADQEKATLPLQTVFTTLRSETKSTFDANTAAHLELMTWMLRADRARRAQLTSAWSELIGLMYGHPAADALPAAKKFAAAAKLADEGKWDEARKINVEAWSEVKTLSRQKP